ncbi:NAD(P)H-dependent oxidoreductase [Micromonospora chalcea]
MVTPEYNHSSPASLKQAIDVAYDELRRWGRTPGEHHPRGEVVIHE